MSEVKMTFESYESLLRRKEQFEGEAIRLRGQLALVDRYGADQWRNGNAGREPQEFEEWRRGQP